MGPLYVFDRHESLWCYFFFNDTATTEIYTLSLHDALPICVLLAHERITGVSQRERGARRHRAAVTRPARRVSRRDTRSEEHTSELQSQSNIVCRLLLEKKKSAPQIAVPYLITNVDTRNAHL